MSIQMAAEAAAEKELLLRRYVVARTPSRTTVADFLVRSPSNSLFSVDVKGLRQADNWRGVHVNAPDSHFIICVIVGDYIDEKFDKSSESQFFIAKHSQIADKVVTGSPNYLRHRYVEPFRDAWHGLPR